MNSLYEGRGMHDVEERIRQADDHEIGQVIKAVIDRYESLFPEWEVMFLSLPRGEGRSKAIRETIGFLRMHEK